MRQYSVRVLSPISIALILLVNSCFMPSYTTLRTNKHKQHSITVGANALNNLDGETESVDSSVLIMIDTPPFQPKTVKTEYRYGINGSFDVGANIMVFQLGPRLNVSKMRPGLGMALRKKIDDNAVFSAEFGVMLLNNIGEIWDSDALDLAILYVLESFPIFGNVSLVFGHTFPNQSNIFGGLKFNLPPLYFREFLTAFIIEGGLDISIGRNALISIIEYVPGANSMSVNVGFRFCFGGKA